MMIIMIMCRPRGNDNKPNLPANINNSNSSNDNNSNNSNSNSSSNNDNNNSNNSTLSLLTLLDSNFRVNPLCAWEFHLFKLRLCSSQTP